MPGFERRLRAVMCAKRFDGPITAAMSKVNFGLMWVGPESAVTRAEWCLVLITRRGRGRYGGRVGSSFLSPPTTERVDRWRCDLRTQVQTGRFADAFVFNPLLGEIVGTARRIVPSMSRVGERAQHRRRRPPVGTASRAAAHARVENYHGTPVTNTA